MSSLVHRSFLEEGKDRVAGQGEQPEQSREVWQPQADVCALRKDTHSSLRRAERAGEAAAAQGRGEVLEEAEKRKEAAVKNRIKGHKKKKKLRSENVLQLEKPSG